MASAASTSQLLALPDPCLLAVMQYCAGDHKATLSAATAHIRLHQAAVEALSSITAQLPKQKKDSLQRYLTKNGQHVHSLALRFYSLPSDACQWKPFFKLLLSLTKLDSLQLGGMRLWQLQHGRDGPQGLLAVLPLTRLELSSCTLLDEAQGLAKMLVQLPGLQQLVVDMDARNTFAFPTEVLTHLVQLTCLRLTGLGYKDRTSLSREDTAALEPLQALTRLADLQLGDLRRIVGGACITCLHGDALSGASQLTRLAMSMQQFDPRALAGKSQLQHLALVSCIARPGEDVAQLLSELQHLTKLTHLALNGSKWCAEAGELSPAPTAYASLTASSNLQHLDFGANILPAAAWQYMFPPGRTLPQLQHLNIDDVTEADGTRAALDTSALVSCCPGLQSLITSIPCSTAQLAPLQQLSGLERLVVGGGWPDELDGVHALCQLTGLQDLELRFGRATDSHIQQLTQLTHLTRLHSHSPLAGAFLPALVAGDEPVWRQLLQHLVASRDTEVAQQAAAGLAAA